MARADAIDRWIQEWERNPEADDDLPLRSLAVGKRINRITRELEKLSASTLAPLDLDPGEFDVLAALLRSGPPYELPPTRLNESLMMSGGGLTKRLIRLEERGLITRRPAPNDRRSLLVVLSPAGTTLAGKAIRAHSRATAERIDRIGTARRDRLSALLRELLLELDAD